MKVRSLPSLTRLILSLVRPNEWHRLARWCAWCVLLAATVNILHAASLVNTFNDRPTTQGSDRRGSEIPKYWPSSTLHAEPWPLPDYWREWRGFGKRVIDVLSYGEVEYDVNFGMTVYWSGWPLPVLEKKRFSVDRTNPAFSSPDTEPPLRVMPLGFILNSIIIGAGPFVLLAVIFMAYVLGRRFERLRHGLCPNCGCKRAELDAVASCPHCKKTAQVTQSFTPRAKPPFFRFVRPSEWRKLALLFVWCILLAAVINVPFAASRMEPRRAPRTGQRLDFKGEDIPKRWPLPTPHATAWPLPNRWTQYNKFARTLYEAEWADPKEGRTWFSMRAQVVGWPLPVLEEKGMRWDHRSPSDYPGMDYYPGVGLLLKGAILNPIIVGGSVYLLLASTFLVRVVRKRSKRMRRGLCLACGYDLHGLQAGSDGKPTICPECGSLSEHAGERTP